MISINEYLDVNKVVKEPPLVKKKIDPNAIYVAIEDVMEPNYDYPKGRTSYRVITLETYEKLKRGIKTTYGEHRYYVLGRAHTKEEAESYLPSANRTPRKSKIDKGFADYIVYVISLGKFQNNGNTKFEWNLWEESQDGEHEIYFGKYPYCALWGRKGSLKEGDKICVVDNDSQRKVTGMVPKEVYAVFNCSNKIEFAEEFRNKFPQLCKKPFNSFGKRVDGIPWQKFSTIYSIKGVQE